MQRRESLATPYRALRVSPMSLRAVLPAEGQALAHRGSSHCLAALMMYFFSTSSSGRIRCSLPPKKGSFMLMPSTRPLRHRFMKKVETRSSALCPRARWVSLYCEQSSNRRLRRSQAQRKQGERRWFSAEWACGPKSVTSRCEGMPCRESQAASGIWLCGSKPGLRWMAMISKRKGTMPCRICRVLSSTKLSTPPETATPMRQPGQIMPVCCMALPALLTQTSCA